jgi:hypothetical protein
MSLYFNKRARTQGPTLTFEVKLHDGRDAIGRHCLCAWINATGNEAKQALAFSAGSLRSEWAMLADCEELLLTAEPITHDVMNVA